MNESRWLQEWCAENVNRPTAQGDKDEARSLAIMAREDANEARISINNAIAELGYGSLEEYILYELDRQVDDEVEYRAARERA